MLLTSDAARVLNVSADEVRRLERTGRLKALRSRGGVRLFSESDVARLKAERDQRRRKVAG